MTPAVGRVARGALGFALVLVVWQVLATGPLDASPLPTATATLATLGALLPTPELWGAIGQTLVVALGGLVAAVVVGVALGLAIATSALTRAATKVVVEFLKPIPPIVILPLVLLTLGPTQQMGLFLVFFGSVLAIAMQTAAGVMDVDPVALATARSFSMGRAEVLRRVVLPSATSYIGTAVRVAAPISLLIAVVAGLVGGAPGLGQSLLRSQLTGSQTTLFAYVIVLGLLGLAVQGVAEAAERRLLHWHPSQRARAAS